MGDLKFRIVYLKMRIAPDKGMGAQVIMEKVWVELWMV
jgi:hypothetical protein